MNKNFVLIGSAGYIAERHMKAIKETGNNIICAMDKSDVMGRMDSYFPEAEFFTTFSYFERYLKRNHHDIDYVSICVPNDMHLFYTRVALSYGLNVICEKPLALTVSELSNMDDAQSFSEGNVHTILQLRYHPAILQIRKNILNGAGQKKHHVHLEYITSRGKWYYKSWKGDVERSGGVLMNIGIHFFDMLLWIFGDVVSYKIHAYGKEKATGTLELERATVHWNLSLDYDDLPKDVKAKGQRTYRSITIDGTELEFSDGFTNLHTVCYQDILDGNGYGIVDIWKSIELVNKIQNFK
jgi:UDP-N-acetyl-2-amino-2-deoxyglucuronate dehydrogenase